MSAYIFPNSILFLAIVATIILIARHLPEASRQLKESGGMNKETTRDVFKRWLQRARGGLRSFWRFVLEGKGLRDPKGSTFRMRQLLEQNRLPKAKTSVRPKNTSRPTVQPSVASAVSSSADVSSAAGNPAVVQSAPLETVAASVGVASSEPVVEKVAAPKPPKVSPKRKSGLPPIDPNMVMQQAKVYIDAKEFLRARHELEQVAENFLDSPVFWARLGYVQYHLGAYLEAVRCYQKSLGLDSNQANRYYNLALAHEAAQEHAESLAALDRALALDPDNAKYRQTRDALKTM